MKKHLIVIVGPTASGKTSLAIQLANHFKTEILSADSRQFFKEMSIGTAKPTPQELKQAKHHFIDTLSIQDEYSVGVYERDASILLERLFDQHNTVIMAGGSGLYIRAVCEGLDEFPVVGEEVRAGLIQTLEAEGIEILQKELQIADPDYYAKVDLNNPQRVVRALEICRGTGQPYSSFRTATVADRPFNIIKIGLNWEREQLYNRINQRVDIMLEEGLEQEAKSLYPFKELNALQTVGYQEWFDFFDEKIDRAEAIRLIKRNTRRYAKRQTTWLRREKNIQFFNPSETAEIIAFIEKELKSED